MSSEQELKCVFCNEIFTQKEDLQVHFRKHADPTFNQKKHKGRTQDESDTSTEKPKVQVEMVECDVCPEVFSSISKAITHKHKMHPDHDTKYFCPWCGKLFTMKHLYKKHMQAAHVDTESIEKRLFHCDSCEIDFYASAAMLYHNKFYHRQDELPNLGNSKKLKMILEEIIQIYYCPFCGEEHENKVNLHKHINDDHCGENRSPDDVFRCPLCDAIFFYLDAYELHLTYHSVDDLYTERNELMNVITDFSLETVQPLQEKVENAEPNNQEEPTSMGIEQLLEFSMNDTDNIKKSKKHKKHKKSKKAAITLDEFLSMNQDVFGEGLDFQGVEEVPTQVVAKRLKTKKGVPQSKLSPDLAKLKKQGIVVKKQPSKTSKPLIKNNVAIKSAINTKKILNPASQVKSLTSTDAVLTKLLNQGSQIKIVKKGNQDSEEQAQQKQVNVEEAKSPLTEEKNGEGSLSDVDKAEDKCIEASNQNTNTDDPNVNSVKSPNPESPSIGEYRDNNILEGCDENSNHSACSNDISEEPRNISESKISNSITTLQNNRNITMKLPKQISSTSKEIEKTNDNGTTETEEIKPQDNTENNSSSPASGNSSLSALKHLSHLITVKSLNPNKAIPLPYEKLENSQKSEILKTPPEPKSNLSKVTGEKHLSSIKNLDGLTIKSTTKSNVSTRNNHQSVKPQIKQDDEDLETDEEWHDDENEEDEHVDRPAITRKSPQLNVDTKHSPKTFHKESPKGVLNNDNNSQSSMDLLKHLKNVTAKPINIKSQKLATLPQSSPNTVMTNMSGKTSIQKEMSDDGTEIFSIDDSDSDEGHGTKNTSIKKEDKIDNNKSISALINTNKNITIKSTSQRRETTQNKISDHCNKMQDEKESDKELDRPSNKNSKFSNPKVTEKNVALNNVLKNLSRNITVKSRNSSPSQSAISKEQNFRDSHLDPGESDSDSDMPLSRVKITEMGDSDEELEDHADSDDAAGNVKVEHPDDSHSDPDEEALHDDYDDMSDIESHIAAAKVQRVNSKPNSNLTKNLNIDTPVKTKNNIASANHERESSPTDDIPAYAKNLSNQISIKQVKKPESINSNVTEQNARSTNQSSVSQKTATSSNQVNTFNKEVKTVKTFQTQTKTVIQEITTTVTKTIKTVNQTSKQEVRNMALSSSPMVMQKVQGLNANFGQKNLQGVKVRQSVPNVRPKIRGQAPQTMRPAICAPPQVRPAVCAPPQVRPAICAPPQVRSANCTPVRANQLVPVRPALNRPSGPRPRMPNVGNMRPSTSGQQRPQMSRPVKVSPRAVTSSPKKPAEPPGHFSCFKKPKESLIPEPDFSMLSKSDDDTSAQFSSTTQMSKSNFTSTSKIVKGNSVVTSTQMKTEMSASSQQLSKLRGVSGLVVKTSQSQAKQTHVEEKCEMSASKRNALEAIQKLQNQGLLVKKPKLDDVSEYSDHDQSPHDSDDMGHVSNDEFDD